MSFFEIYTMVLCILFLFLIGWLLPKAGSTYDILKLRLDLFPNWFRYLALSWIVVAVVLCLIIKLSANNAANFILVNLNFSLFLFFFSKEKKEDEFSEQLRLKSFIYSFISFVAFLIMFGSIKGSGFPLPEIFLDFGVVQLFLGIALFSSLVYFYITKYKSNKNLD